MDDADSLACSQTALWNGDAGEAWVEAEDLIDRLFRPMEDMLAHAVRAAGARNVLDVGCGTGATTIAAARAAGAAGHCIGVDISQPMIAAARDRAAREGVPARFVRADAQSHDFAPGSVDMIISRFGVMFFDDPVRAFTNLRGAARKGAPLCLIAWRGPDENPFMTAAERAAAPLLPDLPRRDPDAPGQFAFADARRVQHMLEASGWGGIDIRPHDFDCAMSRADLGLYLTRMGPLGRVLPGLDAPMRSRVIEAMRAGFQPFVKGEEVRFAAACWSIEARNSDA